MTKLNRAVRLKVYFQRATAYANMARTPMLFYLVISDLDQRQWVTMGWWALPAILLALLALELVGWLEHRSGWLTAEQNFYFDRLTAFKDLRAQLDRIEARLEGLEYS